MPEGTGPTKAKRGRLVISRCRRGRVRVVTTSGETIWLTVTDVDRGKVRLCIDAPVQCKVVREELLPLAERYERTDGKERMPTHGLGSE